VIDPLVEALQMTRLETRLGRQRFVCASLELEFDFAATDEEKDILANRWVKAMKVCDVLQLALDLMKRQQEMGPWETLFVD